MVGTATSELVFIATKDFVQWVQIYGLSRPTDANDVVLAIVPVIPVCVAVISVVPIVNGIITNATKINNKKLF